MPSPDFKLSMGSLSDNLKKLQRKSPDAFHQAMKVGGLQFLEWSSNGSVNDSSRPPIREGFLRGSGSAFVGSELVGITDGDNRDANRSYNSQDKNQLTVGYNSVYARKMHEDPDYEVQKDGDKKWLENHIMNDKEALYKAIEIQFEKELAGFLPKDGI